MNKEEGLYEIGEINFKDIKVKIYHDKYTTGGSYSWRRRNTKGYVGTMFIDKDTGAISYPKDAVVPELTDHDLEMLPYFVITKEKEITDEFITDTLERLEKEYKQRNK